MEYKSQKIFVIGLIGLVLALIVGGVAYAYMSRETLGSVDGTKISKNEFIFILKQVRDRLERSMVPEQATLEEREKFWNSKVEGKTARETAEEIALDEAKKIKIQLIKAKENNVELTKEEKDKNKKEVDQMIEQLGGASKANERIFEVYGIPTSDYKKIREEMSLIDKYIETEKAKLEASDQEILDYYNKNFENDELVTVRHILLSTVDNEKKPLPDEEIEKQRVKAEEILEKLKNGEDIEKLVKEFTADLASMDDKGQYTIRKGQQKIAEFEEWAFNNAPGSSGVIKSDYGYHVMVKPTFEELKDDVKDGVLNDKYGELLNEWVKLPKYELVVNQKALKNIRGIVER